jgi:DNA-binding Lrp family transcriptional regulator
MDRTDRQLLNILQTHFPLVSEPFAAMAQELEVATEEVLARTRRLKDEGIIRQISAIFDSRHLGYRSTLVAAQVRRERLDEAAAVISCHPGVSHNYARDLMVSPAGSSQGAATKDTGVVQPARNAVGCQGVRHHSYNLWFTLTLPPEEAIEDTVARLARKAGVEKYLILPAERVFKIGMKLNMLEAEETRTEDVKAPPSARRRSSSRSRPPSGDDKAIIRELQEDLDIVQQPFADMARRLTMSTEELLTKAKEFQEQGVMRRFSAVLRHRRAGFAANGMGCWIVPPGHIERVGTIAASFSSVSHCYQRPAYPPDWPYNLFTMIHAHSREEVEDIAATIAESAGVEDFGILYSTTEYKKERVKYFMKEVP